MPNTSVRAAAEGIPAPKASEPLSYLDMEGTLHDAVNMADIVCDLIEAAQCEANNTESGLHLSDNELRLIVSSIYHSAQLVGDVMRRWVEVHDSHVAAEEGGAE
jgi:hypothetical protein